METEKRTNHEDSPPKLEVHFEDEHSRKWGISSWITYSSIVALMVSYCFFLYDRNLFHSQAVKVPGLTSLETLFDAIEKYSPFHEFLMDEDYPGNVNIKETKAEQKTGTTSEPKKSVGGVPLLTAEELKLYDGSDGSPGLYIALLGQVFDVSKGKEHYGPGGGYSFFAAKDGSRAFVTGEFNDEGLIDDVTGLDLDSYLVT